jgi:uncharacterized protein YjbI with pentapeptide repeats
MISRSKKARAPFCCALSILTMLVFALPCLADDPPKCSAEGIAGLPSPKALAANPRVPAGLLVKALQAKKKVTVQNCRVDGNVTLDHARIESASFVNVEFGGALSIKNSEFTGQLLFYENTHFEDSVEFESVKFNDQVSASGGVVFDGWFSAHDCTFLKQVQFDNVRFNGGVSFNASRFHKQADFTASTFARPRAVFEGTVFLGPAGFEDTTFASELSFEEAVFEQVADFHNSRMKGEVTFESAQFKGDAYFSYAVIAGRGSFPNAVFLKDLYLDGINNVRSLGIVVNTEVTRQGRLYFWGVSFLGRVSLVESQLDTLDFSERGPISNKTVSDWKLVSFEKRLAAQGLNVRMANFTDVEFRGGADFSGSTFSELLSLSNATFSDEADFYQCKFPSPNKHSNAPSGTFLAKVRFEKGPQLHYSQLLEEGPWWQFWNLTPTSKVATETARSWQSLERSFMKSADLDSQNEAMYYRRTLAPHAPGEDKENFLVNRFSKLFWGYGVRPWRLAGWIVLFFGWFTFIYWTQTKELGNPARRWKFALGFSWRTSLTLWYGYQNSRTLLFKVLSIIHSISIKIMLVCFLKAIANVSPLLRDLLGKILPI